MFGSQPQPHKPVSELPVFQDPEVFHEVFAKPIPCHEVFQHAECGVARAKALLDSAAAAVAKHSPQILAAQLPGGPRVS